MLDTLMTLIIFTGSGILLSFSPCVLPMVPIISQILVKQSKKNKQAFQLTFIYVLSQATCYTIMGFLLGALGNKFTLFFQKPIIIISFSIFLIWLALNPVYPNIFRFPNFIKPSNKKKSVEPNTYSLWYPVTMGMSAVLIISPCISPALALALSFITQKGNALLGACAFFCLGFGMGIPFLIFAGLGARYLPKVGPWMQRITYCNSILIILVAISLLTRIINPMAYFTSPQMQTEIENYHAITSANDLNKSLAVAKKQNQVVLIKIHADWCKNCQIIEKTIFKDDLIKQRLLGIAVLELNLSNPTLDTIDIQNDLHVQGLPTYIIFDNQGVEIKRFIGELPKSELLSYLN